MSTTPNIVLNVNGIEVIYNHVILVLKGVSLNVPEGKIAAVLGGIWMLLTGRNPLKLYQTYAGFARRMPGGGFQWGMPTAATQPATEPPSAGERVQERFSHPRTEVEDVVVKEVR